MNTLKTEFEEEYRKLISYIGLCMKSEEVHLKDKEQFSGATSDIYTDSLLEPMVDRLKFAIQEAWFTDEENIPSHLEVISWISTELLSSNPEWKDLSSKAHQMLISACRYCAEKEGWTKSNTEGWQQAIPWHWSHN